MDDETTAKVQQHIANLQISLISDKLRLEITWPQKLKGATRCISIYQIPLHHAHLRKHVLKLDEVELDASLHSSTEKRKWNPLWGNWLNWQSHKEVAAYWCSDWSFMGLLWVYSRTLPQSPAPIRFWCADYATLFLLVRGLEVKHGTKK